MKAKKFYMRIRNTGIGVGGWHCNCCAPAPKHRKAYIRAAKKKEKVFYDKFMRD